MKRFSSFVLCCIFAGCTSVPVSYEKPPQDITSEASSNISSSFSIPGPDVKPGITLGNNVAYTETSVTFGEGLGADFKVNALTNMKDIEQAFGIALNAKEKQMLEKNKFVMLPLTETSIRPTVPKGPAADRFREFLGLYNTVRGNPDYKERTQANNVFLTTDLFFHFYNLIYTELLKEMENTMFAPAMRDLTATFYKKADAKFTSSKGDEKETWRKVRNYFAIPYTLLSTANTPPSSDDYMQGDPAAVQSAFDATDKSADTIDTATTFVNALHLDDASSKDVLADLQMLYKASEKGVPAIFQEEFTQYADDTDVTFEVDFSQFTPRSHYTSSSLRRQYFRSMMWFSQVPFFLKSPALTEYAFAIAQLMADNPSQASNYAKLEATINFLVGTSDDLMPTDYLMALESAKNTPDQEAAVMDYLVKARPPKIKGLAALYPTVGEKQTGDVLLLTKGMRFFSGKFIIDSYWTGQLTQGDEAPKPGYTQKLPPMASSLEVMALLGSDYAKSQIPTLDFYKPETKQAIDKAMADLKAEADTFDQAYWTSNLYNGWLWTIKSLFTWEQEHRAKLPRFMQSELWPVKTLMTGAGFWTELRHATLLYAKQSFAELGGGGPCDPRKIPPVVKGYIEPQMQAFDRLAYLANRTKAGLEELGFEGLRNQSSLNSFVIALDTVRTYVSKELENQKLADEVIEERHDTDVDGSACVSYWLKDDISEWEDIRVRILRDLEYGLPWPVEGPILPAKDKRAALVADVHTGGDSSYPHRILYEGTGVPNVILVAVNDANGPRLTVGFTYSQYEFTEALGGPRKTDEEWQKIFYNGDDTYNAFEYTSRSSWPAVPSWFAPLFAR